MLREETVEPSTLELLRKLIALPKLQNFRLVGGTALSLMYDHRKSAGLDLFIDNPLEKPLLPNALQENFAFSILNNPFASILQCVIENVKVDFVSVEDSFKYPINSVDNIPLTDIRELVALK